MAKPTLQDHLGDEDDIGEFWRLLKAEKKQRNKARYAEGRAQVAADAKASVLAEFNHGHQLRIWREGVTVDYWPSTGTWCVVGTKEYRKGGYAALVQALTGVSA